ncbi:hypothetical protein K5L12_14905, partial [Mycolicibacterium austroafricanum]
PTPKPPPVPKLSVPPPRVHHGSSPRIHETRDMLLRYVEKVEVAVVGVRWSLGDQQKPNPAGLVMLGGLCTASAHLGRTGVVLLGLRR